MEKSVIIWPIYSKSYKKLIQDGSIDGVPTKDIWEQCGKESRAYFKHKKKTNEKFRIIMNQEQ